MQEPCEGRLRVRALPPERMASGNVLCPFDCRAPSGRCAEWQELSSEAAIAGQRGSWSAVDDALTCECSPGADADTVSAAGRFCDGALWRVDARKESRLPAPLGRREWRAHVLDLRGPDRKAPLSYPTYKAKLTVRARRAALRLCRCPRLPGACVGARAPNDFTCRCQPSPCVPHAARDEHVCQRHKPDVVISGICM
jgi:hypothetical protein